VDFKFDARDLALSGVFAGLYTILNVVQMTATGGYTIYGPIQFRVADSLIALSALLGWPVVAGVTVGCFLTNSYYFLGPADVIFGTLANFIAASLILLLRRRQLLACIAGALPIGFIVGGGYLWWFFPPPAILNLNLPAWLAMMISITVSSLIAIAGIGYVLLRIIHRPGIIESLKSRGLKTLS